MSKNIRNVRGTCDLPPLEHFLKYFSIYRSSKSRCAQFKHFLYIAKLSKLYKIDLQKASEIYSKSLSRKRGSHQSFTFIEKYLNVKISHLYIEKQTHKELKIPNVFVNKKIKELCREASKIITMNTHIKKYGKFNNNRALAKQTNLKKYGCENVMQNYDIMGKNHSHWTSEKYKERNLKSQNTNLKKYGTKNAMQNPEIAQKVSKSWQSKSQDEINEICSKRKAALPPDFYKKLGIQNSKNQLLKRHGKKFNKKFIRKNFIKDNKFLSDKCADYFKVDSDYIRFIKNYFGITEPSYYSRTKSETAFLDAIEEKLGAKIERQYKAFPNSNKKVDGFDPASNTIYEYLGDYWHGRLNNSELNFYGRKFSDLFKETEIRFLELCELGFKVYYIWDSDFKHFGIESIKNFNDILES